MKEYILPLVRDEFEYLLNQISLAEIFGNEKLLLKIEYLKSILKMNRAEGS